MSVRVTYDLGDGLTAFRKKAGTLTLSEREMVADSSAEIDRILCSAS